MFKRRFHLCRLPMEEVGTEMGHRMGWARFEGGIKDPLASVNFMLV